MTATRPPSATRVREGTGRIRLLAGIGLCTSIWLLAAPFVLGYPGAYPGVRSRGVDIIAGLLGFCAAAYHALNWRTGRLAARLLLWLGLVLFVLPTTLGFFHRGDLRAAAVNDMICGALLAMGAVLSLAASDDPA